MFDIGFWELALIGVVALLVIGPERLPGLARTAGIWLGKGRRFVSSVKADVEREIRADELKRIMKEQAQSSGVHEIIEETRSGVEKTRESLDSAQQEMKGLGDDVSGSDPSTSPDSESRR